MNVMDTRATSAMLYLDGVHVSFDGSTPSTTYR